MALATCGPSESGKSHNTTLAPARANRSAVAFPRPEAPPVTKAVNPYKNIIRSGEREHIYRISRGRR